MSDHTTTKRDLAERIGNRHGLGQVQTLAIIQEFLDKAL